MGPVPPRPVSTPAVALLKNWSSGSANQSGRPPSGTLCVMLAGSSVLGVAVDEAEVFAGGGEVRFSLAVVEVGEWLLLMVVVVAVS